MQCIIFLFTLTAVQCSYQDQDTSPLDKCLKSIEKIQQLSCRVDFRSYDKKGSPTRTGLAQYLRNGAKFRIKETLLLHDIDPPNNTTESDIYSDDGITQKVLSKHKNVQTAGIRNFQRISITHCDAYDMAMFNVLLPKTLNYMPLRAFTKQLINTTAFASQDEDRHPVFVITGDHQQPEMSFHYTLHFDASANHLIKFIQIDVPLNGKLVRHRFQVKRFTEVESGIFFPVETKRECHVDNQLLWFADMKLTDVMINKELPALAFDFRFPHGIVARDSIRSSKYQVDEHGNRISEEKPIQLGIELPSSNPPPKKK